MKVGDKPYLSVARTSICGEDDVMALQIVNPETNEIIRLRMSFEEYARVLTGEIHVPTEVVRYQPPEDKNDST